MNENLELKLQKKYPKILRDLYKSEYETCMAWGIECRDGWYDLLDEGMAKIQELCDSFSKDGREVQLVAAQIKSKFATLRFYVDIYDATKEETNALYKIVDEMEQKSSITCEICGEKGKLYPKGWHSTLCEEHAAQIYDKK
jgi:hypothetical protein